MPRLSVIVPVYKVEKYIHKCVDSILNQTFTDFELILVDDGSPDKCGEICDEYAKKDARIRVIHKENGGLSDARNFGIDAAKGEIIGFVDSDDIIDASMYGEGLTGRKFLDLYKLEQTLESADGVTKAEAYVRYGEGNKLVLQADVWGGSEADTERLRAYVREHCGEALVPECISCF